MIPFDWGCTTRLVYGEETEKSVGERVKPYSSNVLLVYGGGSIKRSGLYDCVVRSLQENGIAYHELSGIRSNPTLEKINDGIALCRKENIDFILAVGGGSAIDTAKAVAIGVPYDGDVWDFFIQRVDGKEVEKALPVADILTIPGTGTESSPNCVVTNGDTKDKIGICSDLIRPVFSIMNPELCTTIPASQIAPSLYDAMSHTMDRYFTNTLHTEMCDEIDEAIVRTIMKYTKAVCADPSDVDAWGELMLASDLSHCGVSGLGREGDWACHKIEEAISGLYDIPHGVGLSIITPAWMRYVYKKHIPMFVQFAVKVMGVHGSFREEEALAEAGIRALEDFSRSVGLPTRLSEIGITSDEHFEWMAKRCSILQGGTTGMLERLTWEDIVEIYRLAQ